MQKSKAFTPPPKHLTRKLTSTPKHLVRGFTLIELVLAIIIFTLILFGVLYFVRLKQGG